MGAFGRVGDKRLWLLELNRLYRFISLNGKGLFGVHPSRDTESTVLSRIHPFLSFVFLTNPNLQEGAL